MKPFLFIYSPLLATTLLAATLLAATPLATTLLGFSLRVMGEPLLPGPAVAAPTSAATGTTTDHNRSDATTRQNLLGISFQTPEPLSAPVALRGNGVGVLYPATATPGNEDFKLTLMDLPPGDVILDNMSDAEVANWVRFTVLGNNRPVDGRIERTILGRRLIGDLQLQRSRRQTVEEIYLLPLSTGHRLVVTFTSDQGLPLQKIETIIGSIAESMQELPARSPEWRESFRWQKRQRD
jgi:hypothetical protein